MEPHPVPQDILNTEFKLFGSFTLRQFMKIVFGCLAALVVFLLDIPFLVKYPLIAILILLGVALAIVPSFSVKLGGYLKALFISPRYVWVKQAKPTDLLKSQKQANIENQQKVRAASRARNSKLDLSEISLEKMLAARDNPRKSSRVQNAPKIDEIVSPREDNFNRMFNQVYENVKPQKTAPQFNNASNSHNPNPSVQPTQQEIMQQNNPKSNQEAKTKEQYINKINQLKTELSNLVKDDKYKEKEAEIMHQINDLYQELKMLDIGMEQNQKKQTSKQITNMKGEVQGEGQILAGIVVDKNNNGVAEADILFRDINSDMTYYAKSNAEGKFVTPKKILNGDYNIEIKHPIYRFHTYKIRVGEQKLPAYKLRAK